MSLRKQVRSKKYMDEVFETLSLGEKSRYGRQEFQELGEAIGVTFVGGVGTADAIDNVINSEEPEPEVTIWTVTLQLNGGECEDCGNAGSTETTVITTGTTEQILVDFLDGFNLTKEGFTGWGYSYDEAGEEFFTGETTVDVPDDIIIWVQWSYEEE
jgi:hypothetical protein